MADENIFNLLPKEDEFAADGEDGGHPQCVGGASFGGKRPAED